MGYINLFHRNKHKLYFKNILLPNKLNIARNYEDDYDEIVKVDVGGVMDHQRRPSQVGGPNEIEFESAPESRSSPTKMTTLPVLTFGPCIQ